MNERIGNTPDEFEITWVRYSCMVCGHYENSPVIGPNPTIPEEIEMVHCGGEKTTLQYERHWIAGEE